MQKPTSSPTRYFECAVIGDWHLAFITAASLSSLGKRTLLVNPFPETTKWGKFPTPPVTEPGLPEAIAAGLAKGTLEFANGINEDFRADLIWLAIDTPVNEKDEPDTTTLETVAQKVSQHPSGDNPFIISSQIPLGFSEGLEKQLGLGVVYIPENLRLGKGMETFLEADRTVIGASDPRRRETVKEFLEGLKTDFLLCDLATAEMIKHATNAFLATSISFANELARIGESRGVDNQLVGKALKMDKRIGKSAYVLPGLGFAGGTLPRDLRVLQRLGVEAGTPTPLADAVLKVNDSTTDAIADSIRLQLDGKVAGREILVLGYTYKAETDTLRRSLSLELAEVLKKEGAIVWGYDPAMNQRDLSLLSGVIEHFSSWDEIPRVPAVTVLMTPRPEFLKLDWESLASKSENTRGLVFDTRGWTQGDTILRAGFSHKVLWQPTREQTR